MMTDETCPSCDCIIDMYDVLKAIENSDYEHTLWGIEVKFTCPSEDCDARLKVKVQIEEVEEDE